MSLSNLEEMQKIADAFKKKIKASCVESDNKKRAETKVEEALFYAKKALKSEK